MIWKLRYWLAGLLDPGLPSVRVVELLPGDYLILQTKKLLSRDEREHLISAAEKALHLHGRVLVIEGDVQLAVLRAAEVGT